MTLPELTALIVALTTLASSLGGLLLTTRNATKLDAVHESVNGAKAAAVEAAHNAGVVAGIQAASTERPGPFGPGHSN